MIIGELNGESNASRKRKQIKENGGALQLAEIEPGTE